MRVVGSLLLSALALLLALLHLLLPQIRIDPVTLFLMGVALLPWLAIVLRSIEIPGGWKFEFRDRLKAASLEIEQAGLLAKQTKAIKKKAELIEDEDPNLSLVRLRIELEKRLRRVAESHNMKNEHMGFKELMRALFEKKIVTGEEYMALVNITGLLNAAAHGTEVGSVGSAWAIDIGPRLLAGLEKRIEKKPAKSGAA